MAKEDVRKLKSKVSYKVNDEPSEVRRRTGGRSARVREAVLQATWDILLEQGVDGINFSEIGRRAEVHATSVQRRWGSINNLLFEALVAHGTEIFSIPNTGSLRKDLITFARTMAAYFASPVGKSIIQLIVANADNDPAFAAHRAEFVRMRVAMMQGMFRQAIDRGELPTGVDINMALDLALGPLYVRTLITRQQINDSFIKKYVDSLLTGLLKSTQKGLS